MVLFLRYGLVCNSNSNETTFLFDHPVTASIGVGYRSKQQNVGANLVDVAIHYVQH